MPELPEVETVKETLKKQVLYKEIDYVNIYYSNIIEKPSVEEFKKQIKNQKINNILRRGKWLMFELDDYFLLSHLRMEGKYFIKKPEDKVVKHEHIAFVFKDNTELRYHDTRKFGRMYLLSKDEAYNQKPLNELGLEPWDSNLSAKYLKEKLKNKKIPIKTSILDQSIMVGNGNIYVDEVLFLSKINPFKPSNELSNNELQNIINNTKIVLEKAIKAGGTTIRSYTSSEGVHGLFQNELLVHGKVGEKCPSCKTDIIKTRVNGRGTYYCSNCQKNKTNYLILVNRKNKIDAGFQPELVEVKTKIDGSVDKKRKILLEKETSKAWKKLKKAALENNIYIDIVSGYRDFEYQTKILEYYIEKEGVTLTSKRVAKPGFSEHHTGLALDYMSLREDGPYDVEIGDIEYEWIKNNAHKYGFILRYPKDKEDITGYRCEPWHLRYVKISNALEIYNNNLTLEEYLKIK